jgi:hypothetical protein
MVLLVAVYGWIHLEGTRFLALLPDLYPLLIMTGLLKLN